MTGNERPDINDSSATLCVAGQQNQSQQGQSQADPQKSQQTQQDKSSTGSQTQKTQDQAAPAEDSLAAAARKARDQKKDAAKPAKVFTNDNLPDSGGISTVGERKDSAAAKGAGTVQDSDAAPQSVEKKWRDRFAKLHHKLDQDEQELDVLQREASSDQTQFYAGDPNKAMNDQTSGQPFGSDYTKKVTAIDAKKKDIEADKQAISDAEEELRKSGGDSGWAR